MLRDFELDVATRLEAAGAGSMAASPPTLYAGAFPEDGPATLVAVRDAGGGDSEDYLGTTTALLRPEAQVLVRAPQREDARQLAVRCWEALYLPSLTGYARLKPEGSGPVSQGQDANGRAVYTFNVGGLYETTRPAGAGP